jgi:hypothetical protein
VAEDRENLVHEIRGAPEKVERVMRESPRLAEWTKGLAREIGVAEK